MVGVLVGFAIVAAVIVTGYLVGRLRVLGDSADHVLSRISFFVLSPCLLFTVLAGADPHVLFSTQLPITAIACVVSIAVYAFVAIVVWRRDIATTTVGALTVSYANAGNLGIPLSVYVLGDPAASVPVLLFQLVVIAPISLTILDLTTTGRISLARVLTQPVRNPLIIGSLAGLAIAVFEWDVPDVVMQPFILIGGAAIPVVLLNFGLSLSLSRPLGPGSPRAQVVVATVVKLAIAPLVAWAVGRFLFGLDGHALFVATVLAGLPTAQNIYNYARRYERGIVHARDTIFVTTIASLGTVSLIAALLAGG